MAMAAGVSTATVSRALRGLPRVSERTRARVLRAAAELHYVASPTAASLASGKTQVVGVVVPYVTRWYFAELISGASGALRDFGFHALLLDVGDEGADRTVLLDSRMLAKRVDAVAILSLRLHDSERELLQRMKIPVVTVGVPDPPWPCVRIDDVATTELATAHLLALGHRQFGYVGGAGPVPSKFRTPNDRVQGFQQTLATADCPPARVVAADWTPVSGYQAGRQLLDSADRPTALVCASDEMAFGVLRAANDLGLNVPGDVSVTGVDNHSMAELFGLTTVSQDPNAQGRVATELLLAEMAGEATPDHVVTAEITLMRRGSTAAVKTSSVTP